MDFKFPVIPLAAGVLSVLVLSLLLYRTSQRAQQHTAAIMVQYNHCIIEQHSKHVEITDAVIDYCRRRARMEVAFSE